MAYGEKNRTEPDSRLSQLRTIVRTHKETRVEKKKAVERGSHRISPRLIDCCQTKSQEEALGKNDQKRLKWHNAVSV